MKYIWRIIVIVFCVIFVIGFAFMTRIVPQTRSNLFVFNERYTDMKQVYENTFELSKVDKIQIDYGSEDIEIYPSESADLQIKEFMNYDPNKSELSTLWRTGGTLAIEEGDHDYIFFSGIGKHKRIEIYIPEDYSDAVSIHLGSGKLSIGMDMALTEFNLDLQSGAAAIGKINAEKSDIDLSSGKISIDELSGRQDIDVSSGNLDLGMTTGDGEYHCTSGQIDLKVSEVVGDMDINVTSGKIDVTLPEDSEFLYESKVTSGSIDTYFETKSIDDDEREASVGSNPSNRVRVKVTSGKVNLDQY